MGEIEQLEARVADLERRLRAANRDRIGATVLWLATVCGLVCLRPAATAQDVPDVKIVRAQQFVVEDAQGQERGTLGVTMSGPEAGTVSLSLCDPAGRDRLLCGLLPGGDLSVLLRGGDATDRGRVVLVAPNRGQPYVAVTDRSGREIIHHP